MFINEPNFYYYLAFNTIPFTFAVILGFLTVYPMVKKEDAKKRVRKVIIRILWRRGRIRLSGTSRL
jgi:predicted membrane protein